MLPHNSGMNSKPTRWTAAQKAAALNADKVETFTVDLDTQDVRFASRQAKALGMPRDVFVGLLLKLHLQEKGIVPAEANPSPELSRVMALGVAS